MKIGIVGTRGIPANYGGFETFAEQISPLLVEKGIEVTVYCDKNEEIEKKTFFKGVKLVHQKLTKSGNPLAFYFEGVYKGLKENDIILVAGTGGSFFYFLNVFFKRKIVTNTDGVESRRAKWTKFKRFVIKTSETLAVKMSNHLVADSKGIEAYLLNAYPSLKTSKIDVIEYGAKINTFTDDEVLKKHQLVSKQYYLVVSRLEPENNLHLIVDGFEKAMVSKPLIIIGNLLDNQYVQGLLEKKSNKIRFIGGIYDQKELMALRASAFAYIHGHSVGGTNPSLLEALGSQNISICHDNIFNREVTDNKQLYFNTSQNLKKLIEKIDGLPKNELALYENEAVKRIKVYYTWENIALKYSRLFQGLKKISY